MTQQCPHCQVEIQAPKLSAYDDNFVCPQCAATLSHSQIDIFLYAFCFIALISSLLIVIAHMNTFIALVIATVSYRLCRSRFFESYFRLTRCTH
ncbi:hypothetical protein [Photobacterium phosphoreum]|uniref:hypothetical protein n=1 Tax=Photobacterium phosphoreum TaxID=659 RepID=UPI0011B20A53|nr:hypothetical protein [Photobacterium phosphoreum]